MEFRDDPKVSPYYANVLLFGPAKTGKSAGAGSTPGLIGYLNTEQPNSTEFVHERDTENRIMEVQMQKDPKPLLSEIMRSCYPKTGSGFDTWVLDSVGELHRRLLASQSRGAVRPSRDTYGDVLREVEDFCRFMVEAPCNFVIVAHDHPVKDDTTGGFTAMPFTGTSNPSLAMKLLGMVDIVAYTGAMAVEVERDGEMRRDMAYVSQLVPTMGRPVGVRGRFNKLITEEVKQSGVRETNLAEWFEIAGMQAPEKEDKTEEKEAA